MKTRWLWLRLVRKTHPSFAWSRPSFRGRLLAGASDIHLEPYKPEMRVRYRIDGELQVVMTIPNHIEDSVISRIKVMGDMDTTENRRPQDGHLTVFEDGKRVGFRISGIPTVDGQKLVLRLLDEGGQTFDLAGIGHDQTRPSFHL